MANAPLCPADTSPKSDELAIESACQVFIVVSGGDREGHPTEGKI